LLGLSAARPHAGGDDRTELESLRALGDALQIVRVSVLAVAEDDFLRPPGDEEFAVVDGAQVTGIEPAVALQRRGVRLRIFEVTLRDVLATDMDVAGGALRHFPAALICDPDLAARDRSTHGEQREGVRVRGIHGSHRSAATELVPVERQGPPGPLE